MRIGNAIVLFGATAVAAPVMAAVASITLQVGPTRLSMPLPTGFCVPRGYVAGVAEAVAKADDQNATLATLVDCEHQDDAKAMNNYVIVKAFRKAVMLNFEKASTLDQLDKAAAGPNAPKFDETMSKRTTDSLEAATGQRMELAGDIGYAGRDQDCIYLAGRMSLKDKPETSLLMAACTTIAGGKLLTVYRYDARPAADVAKLKAETRAIAASIRGSTPKRKMKRSN